MEPSIVHKQAKIRAQSFTLFLAAENPHVYKLIYRPLIEQARPENRDSFHALNVVMCFLEQLDPFPFISETEVRETLKLAEADPRLFRCDELMAVKTNRRPDIANWGTKIIIWDDTAIKLIPKKSAWLAKTQNALFVIFHCLRNLH